MIKCTACNAPLQKDEAFRVKKNGKLFYYCTEEEYETAKAKAKADKDLVYRLICDIFGYRIINTQLWKEWSTWNKLKPNAVIAEYIIANKEYLTTRIRGLTSSEYAKIRYFGTVVSNSLADFTTEIQPTHISPKKAVDNEMYETPNKITHTRRSLADLEDDI